MLAILLNLDIRQGQDLVLARQRARQIARTVGFERQDQIRIATAVSELVRELLQNAEPGHASFEIRMSEPAAFVIQMKGWRTPPEQIKEMLEGTRDSGPAVGMIGAHRLMDEFRVEPWNGGSLVMLAKLLPTDSRPITEEMFEKWQRQISRLPTREPYDELQRQNEELVMALGELQQRQKELAALNKELEDTNRGVVALYAELDERAAGLRRASDLKSRFLSNMTHEFRTPLNAILNLSRMLLDRIDGDLTTEQERQVSYIRRAASDLSELVNDLLDLAKVEAGKTEIHPARIELSDVFGALRGMMRPVASQNPNVSLMFEDPVGISSIETDESKFSQILRNFVSNALKYTEHGEVRVSAVQESDWVTVCVSDTGIGIDSKDWHRIFEEFSQIAGPHQRRVKGTGLGLPLSKRLAELLGGSIRVRSEIGKGSTFSVTIPARFKSTTNDEVTNCLDSLKHPVLIASFHAQPFFRYQERFRDTSYCAIPISRIDDLREVMFKQRPVAVILDVFDDTEKVWQFLAELKRESMAEGVPVIVIDGLNNRDKAFAFGADDFHVAPVSEDWLFSRLNEFESNLPVKEILIIDDDPINRYLLKSIFNHSRFKILEAEGGYNGILWARERQPAAIFLDIQMPDLDGQHVLRELKNDPSTRHIPVIIHSSKLSEGVEMKENYSLADGVLPKNAASQDDLLRNVRSLMPQILKGDSSRKEAIHHG